MADSPGGLVQAFSQRLAASLRLWPALAAWAAGAAGVLGTAAALGYPPFSPDTWTRWDSNLYLDIARHGYTLFHCAPPHAQHWCGNAAWFPLYPALIALVHLTGVPLAGGALMLAWAFWLGTLALLAIALEDALFTVGGAAALAFAAFVPGGVFEYAVFPLSLLSFALVASMLLLMKGRSWAAGVAAGIAAAAYPVGVAVVPVAVAWLVLVAREAPVRERLRRAAIVGGLGAAGAAATPVVQAIQVGRWDAFFLVQDKYGHSLRDPLAPAVHAALGLSSWPPGNLISVTDLQALLVALVLGLVLVELIVRRETATRLDVLVALWLVASWLFVHSKSGVSVYRSEITILPAALLVRRLPRPLAVLVLGAAVWLTVYITRHYVEFGAS
ncbi:MAG TPA: hypothetical protein VMU72_05180 [Gaiellaceae bacterium]|nr:hypothetical protein [Gaiellaceae bacterium]